MLARCRHIVRPSTYTTYTKHSTYFNVNIESSLLRCLVCPDWLVNMGARYASFSGGCNVR